MRVGVNPEKIDCQLTLGGYHRIIIPVYIPNLEDDYFKDGLKIFKICIKTLLHTIHFKTKISLIDNGCCKAVKDYLKTLYDSHNEIDQLLSCKTNLGKVNAIYSAIKSNIEPFITISDADVMFLPNWQSSVEEILRDFPESGMVSPVPSSLGYRADFVNSTVYYGVFKGKIYFKNVVNPEGLTMFQESIGRVMYDKIHLEKYLIVSNSKNSAVIGCGHFVATFRSDVFKKAPKTVCNQKISGDSDNTYFDIPNDKSGYLRLATKENLAYHLGNVFEPWMETKMNDILQYPNEDKLLSKIENGKPLSYLQYLIGMILKTLLFRRFKKQFFRSKGIKVPF